MPHPDKASTPGQAPSLSSPPPNSGTTAAKNIEIELPDERGGTATYSFKIPSKDNLAASANRLLKFEFPPTRNVLVYERLLKTNSLSAGLTKKALEALPLPIIEKIYQQLWQPYCIDINQTANEYLTLLILAEELCEFNAEQMVLQDIQLIGQRDTGTLHSYYYRDTLTEAQIVAFLSGHGYRTDLYPPQPSDEMPISPLPLYLVCRRLTFVLPWIELLESLSSVELEKYPRLGRLQALWQLLKPCQKDLFPIASPHVPALLTILASFPNPTDTARIATQQQHPRPVRVRVIVEGETEKRLLPVFAANMALDLDALGVDVLPAGGKNHVLSLYRENARQLNIPICVLLDHDAKDIATEIQANLRQCDRVVWLEEGEFEDLYDLPFALQVINQVYQPYPELTPQQFQELTQALPGKGRVHAFRAIWNAYHLGSFDKVAFANLYAEALQHPTDSSLPIPATPTPIQALLHLILKTRESPCTPTRSIRATGAPE